MPDWWKMFYIMNMKARNETPLQECLVLLYLDITEEFPTLRSYQIPLEK